MFQLCANLKQKFLSIQGLNAYWKHMFKNVSTIVGANSRNDASSVNVLVTRGCFNRFI